MYYLTSICDSFDIINKNILSDTNHFIRPTTGGRSAGWPAGTGYTQRHQQAIKSIVSKSMQSLASVTVVQDDRPEIAGTPAK